MILGQVDLLIDRWRVLKAKCGLKLVELDGDPTYLALNTRVLSHLQTLNKYPRGSDSTAINALIT